MDRVLFEAPRKDQQAWLIREFGPDVNLANIATGDVLALETLRLGLRADTFDITRAMAAGVTEPTETARRNVVPGAYRGVAVTSVDCALDESFAAPALHRSRCLSSNPVHRRPQRP